MEESRQWAGGALRSTGVIYLATSTVLLYICSVLNSNSQISMIRLLPSSPVFCTMPQEFLMLIFSYKQTAEVFAISHYIDRSRIR